MHTRPHEASYGISFQTAVFLLLISAVHTLFRNVKEHIPRFGSLVVDGKYYVAIGEEFKQDKRDSASAYVCGVEDSNDAAEIRFELQPFFSDPDHEVYRLSVAGNSMSDRAVDW